jgi:hypothetical protein
VGKERRWHASLGNRLTRKKKAIGAFENWVKERIKKGRRPELKVVGLIRDWVVEGIVLKEERGKGGIG